MQKINDLNQQNKELIIEIMSYKHNLEMMNNDKTQTELSLKNKDSVIEQLRSQINEMNSEINERMKDLQLFEENNQKEIDGYNNTIQELIQEKNILELQNNELTQNFESANSTLKEYNDVIVSKYKDLENKLYKEKQNKMNLEQKYKDKIESITNKYNDLQHENNILKEFSYKPRKKDIFNMYLTSTNFNNRTYNRPNLKEYNRLNNPKNLKEFSFVDQHINRTMYNMNYNPNKEIKKSKVFNNTENNYYSKNNLTQTNFMNNTINSYTKRKLNRLGDSNNKRNIVDNNLQKNNNMINEFKMLLNRIDEKIENIKKK